MHVTKTTTLHIKLDATEQFVTTQNYSDKEIHITNLEARFQEGELRRVDAKGFSVLTKTGKPSKRQASTHWFGYVEGMIAPAKVLRVIDQAKNGRSL